MKRIIAVLGTLSTLLCSLVVVTQPVYAFDVFGGSCNGAASDSAVCQEKANGTTNPLTGSNGLLIKIANIVAIVAGLVAVFIIILSGWKYITSGGDSSKIQSAKSTIMYAVIGLVVIALADVIIGFVLSKL